MGKKGNLLTEAQVRQFMKLADLKPLTPGFVDGLGATDAPIDESHGRGRDEGAAGYGHPDDDRPGARLREVEDELPLDEPMPEEEPPLDEPELEEPPLDEPELEEPGLEEPGGAREVNVDDFLAALEVALEEVLGDEVEVEEEPSEEVEEEPGLEVEEPGLEEPFPGEEEVPELQEMINKITKRVAKRIVKEALQNKNKK